MLQCVTFSILILSKDADIGRFSYLHSEPSWREEFLGLLAIVPEEFIIAEIDKLDDVANKKEIKDCFLKQVQRDEENCVLKFLLEDFSMI